METDNRLKMTGIITDFTIWDDTINLYVAKFHEKFNVFPNILLANEYTYKKLDLYAQKYPERIIDPTGENNIETSSISYKGLSTFTAEKYELDFCFDYEIADGSFILIFDENPDFDGEPEPLPVKDEEKPMLYLFKKTA
jgi:hypothetical protein